MCSHARGTPHGPVSDRPAISNTELYNIMGGRYGILLRVVVTVDS